MDALRFDDPELHRRRCTAIEPPARRVLRSSGFRSDLQARLRTRSLRWMSAAAGAGLAIIITLVAAIVS